MPWKRVRAMPDLRLDDLVAPPARPGFREQLWERIEQRERTASRRWRTVAVVAFGSAVAAASAAGVLAFGTAGGSSGPIDRTLSCPVSVVGGVNLLRLGATARQKAVRVNGKLYPRPGEFWADEGLTNTPLQ